jgi:MbtH protein
MELEIRERPGFPGALLAQEQFAMLSNDEDLREYVVVKNHEEQYSIWLKHRAIPAGWSEAGRSGTKQECLAQISEVWTDMRPASLRGAAPR